ncbi:hypothetical protein [Sporosarcina sp. ACRSL]|nr:hypothetical protein [Sporosarcina sp. ACRSL]
MKTMLAAALSFDDEFTRINSGKTKTGSTLGFGGDLHGKDSR